MLPKTIVSLMGSANETMRLMGSPSVVSVRHAILGAGDKVTKRQRRQGSRGFQSENG